VGQLLTSSSILSLALCPYLVGAAPRLSRSIAKRLLSSSKLIEEIAKDRRATPDLKDHAVVVGFGESGRSAAASLSPNVRVLVLDIDRRLVQKARQLGYAAHVGDATQQEILERAGLGCAKGIVIALSDHRSCKLCASHARRLAPELPIIARARYHLFADEIDAAGADRVVDEESLVGVRLGEEMLVQLGLHWDDKGEGLQHPELRLEP
jgi:CPA2 family monovalent cation:H+ antiporter-2